MTKLEKVSVYVLNDAIRNNCPSDYKMEDTENCSFKETGCIDESECVRCWNAELPEEKPLRIILDYVPAKECKNEDVWYTCYKCGECGRKFVDGFLVDYGGTHSEDEEDEDVQQVQEQEN